MNARRRSPLIAPWQAFLAAALALAACAAGAQAVPANVAVPFYTPPDFMQGVHRYWYAPRAREFAAQAAALPRAIEQLCAASGDAQEPLRVARMQWQSGVTAWDRLAAVAIGPLLKRRSLRQIDFWPTRPELIERAIRAAPADARAMERIGTPAKGFPALEWLLWTKPAEPGSPACRYAVKVAAEIEDEANALAKAFAELAARDASADEPAAVAEMAELVNQWVGGLERLRWAQMERPLRSAGNKPPAFSRAASGSTQRTWSAQWNGMHSLGAATGSDIPAPGEGLVSLETYLRGRGLNPLANKLAETAAHISRQVQDLSPANKPRVVAAAQSMSGLKRLAEVEMAPALEVNMGFSDADGD
jgi:predicted lipoprotein